MTTFRNRIQTHRKWWIVSTVLALLMLLAIGWGFAGMVIDLPTAYQAQFIYGLGALIVVIAFFMGQVTDRLVVRSWDTWLGELGPTQIDMLVPVLQDQKKKCTEGE